MLLEFPALDAKLYFLYKTLILFSFVILTFGLVKKVSSEEISAAAMIKTLVSVMLISLIIANGKHVFSGAQKFFLNVAEVIKPGYSGSPLDSAAEFLESTSDEKKSFIQSLFEAGIYQSLLMALGKLLIKILCSLQMVLMAVQYFLIRLAYIATPVVLPFFMFQSMSQVAMQFVLQTLTIMAWPIGFAITNVMADKMFEGFSFSGPIAYENVVEGALANVAGSILTVFFAALVAGVGTILTPVITHQLFAAGAGLVESVRTILSKGTSAAMAVKSGGMTVVGKGFSAASKLAYKGAGLGGNFLNGGGTKTGIRSGAEGSPGGMETQSGWVSFTNPKVVSIKPRGDFSKETGDLSTQAKEAIKRGKRGSSITSDV